MLPLALPMVEGVANPHPDLRAFATETAPLRPSRVAKFMSCPMSVALQLYNESAGNAAAQTGNIVHDAVEAYHKSKEDREAAGRAALERAREQFPEGDAEKARLIFSRYAADPENQTAAVLWVEAPVRLVLKPASHDPTGQPIVIQGTLDQVRLDKKTGVKAVWDVKTGSRLNASETETEYRVQQAVYTLAARYTLDPTIEAGGLIYTPGYEKARSKVHLPLKMTVEHCNLLLIGLVHQVALVRAGVPLFRPSNEGCRFCEVGPWPNCVVLAKGVFHVSGV